MNQNENTSHPTASTSADSPAVAAGTAASRAPHYLSDGDSPLPQRPPREQLVDKATWIAAIINLVCNMGIVLTGGVVRLTSSGLGCSSWPQCEPGTFTPKFHEELSIHPYIEFGNRTLTGILLIAAIVLGIFVSRREPTASRSPQLKRLAWFPLIGVLVQAVVGGISVLVDLHPALVGSHMVISIALIAVSTWIVIRLQNPDTPAHFAGAQGFRWVPLALGLSASAVVILGTIVTGAGPHSGDATEIARYNLDPAIITPMHSGSVFLFLAFTLVAIHVVLSGGPELGRARIPYAYLVGVIVLTALIGYAQHILGLPIVLVALHMVGATLVTVATVYAMAALFTRDGLPQVG